MSLMLVGRIVKEVRVMTLEEKELEGWNDRSDVVVIVFDNGAKVYASQDEEGNGPGALFGVNEKGILLQLVVS